MVREALWTSDRVSAVKTENRFPVERWAERQRQVDESVPRYFVFSTPQTARGALEAFQERIVEPAKRSEAGRERNLGKRKAGLGHELTRKVNPGAVGDLL